MPPILEVLSGADAERKYPLAVEKVRLGRHPSCEVHIDLNSVSRFHAHILREGNDRWVIEDLNSRNGTYVNGKKIEGRTALKDNDRVKICDVLFVYHGPSGSGAAPAIETADPDPSTTVLGTMDAKSSVEMLVKVKAEAKLRAILEVSQAIAQTLELDLVFAKILDCLFRIFPQADRALVILADGQQLVPRAVKQRRGDETIRFSRTIILQAMREGHAIRSADASHDDRFAMSESIADMRIRSVMCAPLLAQDMRRALGAIQIDTQNFHQQFSDEDLQILLSVASQAAIAIENAQLHSEILDQQRFRQELAFAQQVQKGFLPLAPPKIAGFEFWDFYEAAGQVGGDYFSYVTLPGGRHAVIVGDVAGKGVPAALLMAKATSDSKVALLTHPDDLGAAMAQINSAICETSLEDKFITMVMCVLDPAARTLTIANAGHMSPIIRRAKGVIEEPANDALTGLPVGILEDVAYPVVTTPIERGDAVVLFSDGINEAMNAKEQQYTIERIRRRLGTLKPPASQLGQRLLDDVLAHVGSARQNDDMTLVVMSRVE